MKKLGSERGSAHPGPLGGGKAGADSLPLTPKAVFSPDPAERWPHSYKWARLVTSGPPEGKEPLPWPWYHPSYKRDLSMPPSRVTKVPLLHLGQGPLLFLFCVSQEHLRERSGMTGSRVSTKRWYQAPGWAAGLVRWLRTAVESPRPLVSHRLQQVAWCFPFARGQILLQAHVLRKEGGWTEASSWGRSVLAPEGKRAPAQFLLRLGQN